MSDFQFVGRHSIYNLDYTVVNADGLAVSSDAPPLASFRNFANDVELWNRATTPQPTTGVYRLQLSSVETATAGLYYVYWTYTLAGIPQSYRTDIEIPSQLSSFYEQLTDEARAIVDLCWMRFEDMFDSAIGGPHLKEYAQSSFGRERMAQLLRLAFNRLNTTSQPHQTFSLENDDFPYEAWGGLLESLLYIETIKHLIRSYVEQPAAQNVQTARLDRSNYSAAWQQILRLEEADVQRALDNFKIASLNLGRSSVLVAGGIYGEWARPMPPTRPRARPPVGWR